VQVLVALYSPFEVWCIPDSHVDALRRRFPQHTFLRADSDEETLERITDADAAFSARLRPEHVVAARRLRWVHSAAAGVGNMMFPAMIESPIAVTNSRGIASKPIAEHVIAVTLALFRDLPLALRRQGEGIWAQNEIQARPPLPTLAGSRMLVIGLGSIGAATARLAAAFGAHVVGIRRRTDAALPEGVEAVHGPDRLHAELPLADVVVVSAPHTTDTTHLLGAPELALLKEGAVLVNVSRGKLIDEAALARALATGRFRAALDVFAHEPLAAESPLWHNPHVLITPHVAGFFAGYWPATVSLFAENLRRFGAGEPLLNLVDKGAGY
jgi:phosphoglycerate dehydrogenase-like enzyme